MMKINFNKEKIRKILKNKQLSIISIYILICLPVFSDIFFYINNTVFSIFQVMLEIVCFGILAVSLLATFYNMNRKQIIFVVLLSFFLIINIIFYGKLEFLLLILKPMLMNFILPIWFILHIDSKKQLKKLMLSLEIPLTILLYVDFIIGYSNWEFTYNIWISYQMFIVVIISAYKFLIDNNRMSILLVSIDIAMLFLSGSRTPLFIAILYILILFFIKVFPFIKIQFLKMSKIQKKMLVALLLAMIVLLFNYQSILLEVDKFLMKNGYNIRFIHIAAKGELFDMSGRTATIYPSVLSYIIDNPLFGGGIGGERVYLCKALGESTCTIAASTGYYSHNIFLEIFSSFGIIIGTFLTYVFAKITYINWKHDKYFLFLLITIGFFPLLLSKTLWTYLYFWIFLGYMFLKEDSDKLV